MITLEFSEEKTIYVCVKNIYVMYINTYIMYIYIIMHKEYMCYVLCICVMYIYISVYVLCVM